MRAVAVSIVATASIAFSAYGADSNCAALQLEASKGRAALLERVTRGDIGALKHAQLGFDCFTGPDAHALGVAAGAFFDAKPRDFLRAIIGEAQNREEFLRLLTYSPPRLDDDVPSAVELFQSRILAYRANADLIDEPHRRDLFIFLVNAIDDRLKEFRKANPIPYPLVHPLLGVPMNHRFVKFAPLPAVWTSVPDLGRAHLRTLAGTFSPGTRNVYDIAGGFDFVYEPGSTKPTGLVPVVPWVQRTENLDTDSVVEVLGPASAMYSDIRIPADVIKRLCDRIVSDASGMFDDPESLQHALDERIKREPGAGFPKPLRDALKNAGLDVRKYREIPPTP